MDKEFKSNLENCIHQLIAKEEAKVKAVANNFYSDGVIAPFSLSSEQDPLAPLLALAKASSTPQALTQEQLSESCLQIRRNIQQGKSSNIEIQLHKGRQLSDNQPFPLGNTVIKVLPMDANEPNYLFIKGGDTLDASVFLGGDNAVGIVLLKDKNGDDYFFRLAEFHMLSLRENSDPRKEVGLMTSYLWLTAAVYSSVVFASTLNPIKNLLLSEWLQTAWQQAKEAASKASEAEGSESHE